jgi:hypothetical protein
VHVLAVYNRESHAAEDWEKALFYPFVTFVIAVADKYSHPEPLSKTGLYQRQRHDKSRRRDSVVGNGAIVAPLAGLFDNSVMGE